jgi:invasion protein IalB
MPRLSTKMSERRISIAGAAVLCILVFSGGAVAQTLQPKAVQPAPARPAPAQPAPAPPQWVLGCSNTQGGLDCSAAQSIFVRQAGQNDVRANVVVRVPPDTKKPNLLLQLPLGVYLPSGVTLRFGGGGAKAIPFQSCNQGGCLAEYAIAEAEIASLLNGEALTLSVQTADKKPFTLQVPAAGFAAAYAKMGSK